MLGLQPEGRKVRLRVIRAAMLVPGDIVEPFSDPETGIGITFPGGLKRAVIWRRTLSSGCFHCEFRYELATVDRFRGHEAGWPLRGSYLSVELVKVGHDEEF